MGHGHWSFSLELNTESAVSLAATILHESGMRDVPQAARWLPGGANNRVFKIECGDRAYLLKSYFESAPGLRDRLASDYGFCRFAWEAGVRAVSEPFAAQPQKQAAIYEFVEGRRVLPEEINRGIVDAAIQFIADLNAQRTATSAQQLPLAAEACFSLPEHLERVNGRVERLRAIEEREALGKSAAHFVRQELVPKWQELSSQVNSLVANLPPDTVHVLPAANRCLSPSDFGFHNALLQKDGRIRFFDFEYAGWDDPAKLVCDFFCQPEVPVPIEFLSRFLERGFGGFGAPEAIARRIDLLLPVYRIKWCCIMLNEFLATENQRRRFSNPATPDSERKARQLDRVVLFFRKHFHPHE